MPDLLQQITGAADFRIREHDDPTNRGCQRLADVLDHDRKAA